ncbi:MAG TPA: hypothetical protein VFI96_07135 [Longimicrobiaceae bacterium]|nr:hypothetical protein [Longimicrobiaceae bacterium]
MRAPVLPLLALATALLAGCGPSGPETVYVPDAGFQEGLVVSADSTTVQPGEWVTLHATRLSGPWRAAKRAELSDTVPCTRITMPENLQQGAELSVGWVVEPNHGVEWTLTTAPVRSRKLRFSQPGEYRIWATSRGCRAPFSSDTIRIVVK